MFLLSITINVTQAYGLCYGGYAVTAETLNARSAPSTNSEVLTKLGMGQWVYSVKEDKEGWAYVFDSHTHDRLGWVSTKYLENAQAACNGGRFSIIAGEFDKANCKPATFKDSFSKDWLLNIRAAPHDGTDIPILGTISPKGKNKYFNVHEEAHGFYRITGLNEDLEGWVSAKYVEFLETECDDSDAD